LGGSGAGVGCPVGGAGGGGKRAGGSGGGPGGRRGGDWPPSKPPSTAWPNKRTCWHGPRGRPPAFSSTAAATGGGDVGTPRIPEGAKLRELLRRAAEGDESTLPVVREYLKRPGALEYYSDMGRAAQRTFLKTFTGKNLLYR